MGLVIRVTDYVLRLIHLADVVRPMFRLEDYYFTWKARTKSLRPYGSTMSIYWLKNRMDLYEKIPTRDTHSKPQLLSSSIIGVREKLDGKSLLSAIRYQEALRFGSSIYESGALSCRKG